MIDLPIEVNNSINAQLNESVAKVVNHSQRTKKVRNSFNVLPVIKLSTRNNPQTSIKNLYATHLDGPPLKQAKFFRPSMHSPNLQSQALLKPRIISQSPVAQEGYQVQAKFDSMIKLFNDKDEDETPWPHEEGNQSVKMVSNKLISFRAK